MEAPDSKGKQPSKPIPATASPAPSANLDKIDPIVHESYKDIEFTNIQLRDLEITLGRSRSITVTGKVENLVTANNGSGDLKLENLIVEKAIINGKRFWISQYQCST